MASSKMSSTTAQESTTMVKDFIQSYCHITFQRGGTNYCKEKLPCTILVQLAYENVLCKHQQIYRNLAMLLSTYKISLIHYILQRS